jgi:hypothetical protein
VLRVERVQGGLRESVCGARWVCTTRGLPPPPRPCASPKIDRQIAHPPADVLRQNEQVLEQLGGERRGGARGRCVLRRTAATEARRTRALAKSSYTHPQPIDDKITAYSNIYTHTFLTDASLKTLSNVAIFLHL